MESLRFGLLTVSDRSARGERPDASGPTLVNAIRLQGWDVIQQAVIPDEIDVIAGTLAAWADRGDLDVVLTTGGTGFGQRDVTPEATLSILERQAPGIGEAIRARSMQATSHAMLSRGVAGIRGHTLVVNLPGSPKGAMESLEVLLPVLVHAVALLRDDPLAERAHRSNE